MSKKIQLTEEQLEHLAFMIASQVKKALAPETPMRLEKISEHLSLSPRQIRNLIDNGEIEIAYFQDCTIPYSFASRINKKLLERMK